MGFSNQTHSPQDALGQLRKASASVSAAQKIAHRDYQQAQAELDKWTRRYKLALKEGSQDLVSQAKFQKERYEAIVSRLKTLIDEQTPQLDTIKRNLACWEKQISESEYEVSQPNKINEELEFITVDFEDIDHEFKYLKEHTSCLPIETKEDQDPGKILNEAIQQTREAVKESVINQQSIQQQYNQAHKKVSEWHNKAEIAMQKDDDNLALDTLIAKKVQRQVVTAIKTQLEQQKTNVRLLKNNLSALENVKLMLEVEAELTELKTQLISSVKPNEIHLLPITTLSAEVVDTELEALGRQVDEM